MNASARRSLAALVLALATLAVGYVSGKSQTSVASSSSTAGQTLASPAPGTIRVLYSLDAKQNDQEIIALINDAQSTIYFAMYEFTLRDIADALVAAKERGVKVEGLVDAGESTNSYDAPIMSELRAAGIPVETEKHADGNGIMHIKAIVTDQAYALGSYNWTNSATHENDEVLEIGTDPTLRATYENLLMRLIEKYASTAAASAAASVSGQTYTFSDAPEHVGEYAHVTGTLVDAYTSSSGTVFLDFCKSYKSCPFSAVIFAGDATAFGDLSRYAGKPVTVTGTITSYQSRAEIKLSNPSQLSVL